MSRGTAQLISDLATDVMPLSEEQKHEAVNDLCSLLGIDRNPTAHKGESFTGEWSVVDRGGEGVSDIDLFGITIALSVGNKFAKIIVDKLNETPKGPKSFVEDGELELIRERDCWEEKATALADAVGEYFGVDVGEHSSANCPIEEAHKVLNGEYVTNKADKVLVNIELLSEAMHASYLSNPSLHERLAGIVEAATEKTS